MNKLNIEIIPFCIETDHNRNMNEYF